MADNDEPIDSIITYQEDIADAQPPAPLPAGKYHGSIVQALPKVGKTSGKPYGEVMFRISADQYPPDYVDGNPDGTLLGYRKLSLTQTALARYGMRRFCEAIGAPMGRQIDMMDWIGKEATLDVENRMYEGTMRMDIKAVEKA